MEGLMHEHGNTRADPPTVLLSNTSPGTNELGDGVPNFIDDGREFASPSTGPRSAQTSLRGAVKQSLLSEEVARARGWAWIALLLAISATGFSVLLPLVAFTRAILLGALAGFVAMSAMVLVRTREDDGYSKLLFRVWGYGSALLSLPLMYALGVFSPTPLIVTLGLTFFSMGLDRRHAVLIPTTAIVGYTVGSTLITAGVWPDLGISSSDDMTFVSRVFFVVFVPLVFLATIWFARVSRFSMGNAITHAVEAQRLAGQREAQLLEAQQELEQALRAGAGLGGRYTGALVGDFQLGAVVGRGAMGEVYAANHTETGDPAAVKLLHGHVAGVDALIQRFIREGEIAASLDVANVVRVLDVGAVPDKGPYIAMELLEGNDLAAMLRHRPQLAFDELVELCSEIAVGLDAAHAAGIVHRDLKPGNVFLHETLTGAEREAVKVWKILDFGVSKLVGSDGTLTQGDVIGTPAYMSPEQARGLDADHRADIYALGAVTFRALTGQAPFTGPDMPSILFEVVYRMPERPSSLRADVTTDTERVLAIALAKRTEDRFESAGALAAALRESVHGRLSDELRRRADALIDRNPWGRRVRSPVVD